MAEAWPEGVPYRLRHDGASYAPPERAIRSPTDSGLQRQRAVFTAAPRAFSGNVRMTAVQLETFVAWRDGLGGGVFSWPGHPFSADPVDARFIAGQQGVITPDSRTAKWIVPMAIEILPTAAA